MGKPKILSEKAKMADNGIKKNDGRGHIGAFIT
jgi:hypothetical protein